VALLALLVAPAGLSAHEALRPVVGAVPATDAAPVRIPILMYHSIGAPDQNLSVAPSEFRAEVAWLHRAGFTAVTLQEWWDSWHGGAPLPARPVVISLDDGFANWYSSALPILETYHWPADIELIAGRYGARGVTPHMLSRLVSRYGWELDSHTMTHPHLAQVSNRQLRREVSGSRHFFQRLGYQVNFFCYPYGQYDGRVVAAVKTAGYLAATTVIPGVASSVDHPYLLPRISVPGGLGVSGLRAKFGRFGLL
jgi:peptidoglycan/xylan/chitin deacetylase (PgdA/CDA1 family)